MTRPTQYSRFPALTAAQHTPRLRAQFPSFHLARTGRGVCWHGELRPQDDSPLYRVRIDWCEVKRPRVFVEAPTLHPKAPHLYADRSLCLYYPRDESWTRHKHLANTIVPWTAEWLLFYELWMETGRWFGPEAPHDRLKK